MMLLFILFVVALNFSNVSSQCFCSDWLSVIDDDDNETEISPYTSMRLPIPDPILDYRLPEWIIPVHYDLEVQPFLSPQNLTFLGQVVAWFNLTEETNSIVLHSHRLKIYDIELLIEDGRSSGFEIVNVTFDPVREFLFIETEEYLQAATLYGVQISFQGRMNPYSFKGFVATKYEKNRYIGVTHFEPTNARAVFPCFDEPHLKATFNITIVRPVNMTSLSNMPLIASVSRDDEWVADYFAKSVRMSTYTLAFAVSDFDYVEAYAGETLIRIWARGDAINHTALAIKYAPKMLTFLEDYLGIPYALPKLDIIAVPGVNYGAMENWGLITFDETNLLFDVESKNPDNAFTVLSFLAHEISHQWFGNLVTMKWWNDIWLNEGLTTYMSNIVYENVVEEKPEGYEYNTWHMLYELYGWEMDHRSHCLSFDTLALDQITQIFTRITYLKGSTVTRMMEKFAGSEVLLKGLKKYLQENMYSNVEQDELWFRVSEELQRVGVGHFDVKEIMDTWTKQEGLPIITVTRNYADQTAFVRQKIFSDKRQGKIFPNDTKWTIPLMFTTEHQIDLESKPSKWLHKDENYAVLNKSDGIPDADEWILFNPSLHGYYLVNYDNRNWKMLINQLIANHTKIPAPLRMSILFSLHILKINGFISVPISYSVLEYVRKERDASILFGGVQRLFELAKIFQPTPHYHLFKRYLKYFITPIWEHINSGLEGIDVDGPVRYLKHSTYKLACMAGIQSCLTRIKQVLSSLIKDVKSDPLNRHVINEETVCSLVYSFSQAQWEQWLTMKSNLTYAMSHFRQPFTKTLTCTSNFESIYELLQIALDFDNTELSFIERRSFLYTVSNNYFNRRLALDVLKEKWNTISHRVELYGFIDSIASNIYTQRELDELKQLLSCTPEENLSKNTKSYRKLIKRAEQQVKETEENFYVHLNWLQKTLQNIPIEYDD